MEDKNEILRSRVINYSALAVLLLGATVFPKAELVSVPSWVPPGLLTLFASLLPLELVWRSGLRPRIVWNVGGITIVRWFTVSAYPWSEIVRIYEESNRIHILLNNKDEEVWEFDHLWLWSKLSKRYAARAGKIGSRLSKALEDGRLYGAAVPPPVDLPRRPAALYLLAVLAAVFGQLLTSLS
ncbi:hypothetical protein [Streptoalloteichus hindustanus]|uniref:hypothetical protein n=1 Tax=Streptoalloteichus hindustanus TaxID=2017 RepID=UPI0011614341|nr:hypothetical protein [Streptoalloteichus hindustanus]